MPSKHAATATSGVLLPPRWIVLLSFNYHCFILLLASRQLSSLLNAFSAVANKMDINNNIFMKRKRMLSSKGVKEHATRLLTEAPVSFSTL